MTDEEVRRLERQLEQDDDPILRRKLHAARARSSLWHCPCGWMKLPGMGFCMKCEPVVFPDPNKPPLPGSW